MQTSLITPTKDKYKLSNWKAYNKSLCQRGSLTIWIDDSVLRAWRDIDTTKKVVGQETYPSCVILCCLILKLQYHQPLRQTTGFVKSLLNMMGLSSYAIPDYSTLCRRQMSLPVEVSRRWKNGEKIAIAVDSTGLKVYGEGEWKVRRYGTSKRRTWRKMHIGIDLETQEIVSVALTGNDEDDAWVAQQMLKDKQEKVKSFHGDGAYDSFGLRELLEDIIQVIPPPTNAVIHQAIKSKEHLQQRNEAVAFIESHDRKRWKEKENYHRRSLNEVAMFRFKTSFGGELQARTFENQKTEVNIKCKILNVYRDVGMPVSYKVA